MKKNLFKILSKYALLILVFFSSCFSVQAQYVPLPDCRSLYVDDFIKFYSDDIHVNPSFSILGVDGGGGVYTKEDQLLEYCKENHITHIVLYDLHLISSKLGDLYDVSGGQTYGQHLCRFINKAKTDYCIQTIGAAGYSSYGWVGSFNANYAQTAVYNFANQAVNSVFNNHFSFVTQPHAVGDPLFFRAENAKMFLRLMDFSQVTGCDFDVLTMEYEFWTTGPDDQNVTDPGIKFNKFLNANTSTGYVYDMDAIAVQYNLKTELYLGYFMNDITQIQNQAAANLIDGMYDATHRRFDRILLHSYRGSADVFEARQDYRERLNPFLNNSQTINGTDVNPIFSAEGRNIGADYNFLGKWFREDNSNPTSVDPFQPIEHNIFNVEKQYYSDWRNGNSGYGNANPGSALENLVSPGSAHWFTSKYMVEQLKSPIIFRSDFPCTPLCSATVHFNYQGPIESGVGFSFNVEDQNGVEILPSSGTTTGTTPDYSTTASLNTFPNYPSILPIYDLKVNDQPYFATCTLTYTTTCKYIYKQPVLVSHDPHIIGVSKNNPNDYSGPYTICDGDFVSLYASQGTTYQWKINGRNIPSSQGGQSQSLIAYQDGVYTCDISGTGCTGRSNPITVIVNSNPYPLVEASCSTSGGSVTLTAVSAPSSTCFWSNQTTGTSITVSSAKNYYLYVDNGNGCYRKTKFPVTSNMLAPTTGPSAVTVTSTTGNLCELGNSGVEVLTASASFTNNPNNKSYFLWSTSLDNTTLSVNRPGVYRVLAIDEIGCSALSAPYSTISLSQGGVAYAGRDQKICTQSVSAVQLDGKIGGSSASPVWTTSGTGTFSPNANILNAQYLPSNADKTSGSVTLTLSSTTSANCSSGSAKNDQMVVTFDNSNLQTPVLNITASPSITICQGTTVTFTASTTNLAGGCLSYQWKLNNAPVGINSNTYSPSTPLSNSDVIKCEVTFSDVCATTNFLNSSVTMTVNPIVNASVSLIPTSSTICFGQTATFTATATNGGASPSYEWSLDNGATWGTPTTSNGFTTSSAQSAGVYSVLVRMTSNATCISSNPVATSNVGTLTINANPTVSLASFNPVCQSNTQIALTGGSPNGGAYSGSNVSLNNFTPSTVGTTTITYTVTVSGCTSSSSSSISVSAPPTVTLAAFSNVCQSTIAFSLSGGSPAGGTYSGTNVNSGTGMFTPSASGPTTITYTYSSGVCTRSATSSITVLPTVLPAVSLTSNPTSPICEGTLVQFAVSNSQNQGTSPLYSWSTDNGSTWTSASSGTTFQFNFTTVGTFQVLLRMTSNATCASPQTITSLPYPMEVTPFTKAGFDLVIKDNDFPDDAGLEPNPDNGPMWESDYIWTRRTPFPAGGVQEDPLYSSTANNYVFVQIWNRGCSDYTGTGADMHLYWAKASTGLAWPDYWDGIQTDPCLGTSVPISGVFATQTIPAIHRKQFISTPMMFSWLVEDPTSYQPCFPADYRHFCLLARIESAADPIGVEVAHQYTNTQNYNNIAWKNLSVVNVALNSNSDECFSDHLVGGVVAIGNPFEEDDVYDFIFKTDETYSGKPITEQAEIKLTLDEKTWNKWVAGGKKKENLKIKREDCRQLVVTGNPAKLQNLSFEKQEHSALSLSFNFLTNEVDATPQFDYHLLQVKNEDNKSIIGGEMYRIGKPTRYLFLANGGGNKSASLHENINLVANTIGEDAFYNWYDQGGSLVYSGTSFNVSPDFTTKYKLEVIAKSDGFTSYDSVLVHIKEYEIINLNPNPTAGQLTVEYEARKATSGYLSIVQPYTAISNNYMIDVNQTSTTLNLSGYIPGSYFIRLICDGQIRDEKTIVIIQ